MINFDFNSIVEGLKEYYSEKAAELLAKYLLENEHGSSLPIIAVLNEDNNEYEVSIGYDIISDFYQEFDTEGFVKYLEENEKLYGDDILISDDNLVICYMG